MTHDLGVEALLAVDVRVDERLHERPHQPPHQVQQRTRQRHLGTQRDRFADGSELVRPLEVGRAVEARLGGDRRQLGLLHPERFDVGDVGADPRRSALGELGADPVAELLQPPDDLFRFHVG